MQIACVGQSAFRVHYVRNYRVYEIYLPRLVSTNIE